MKTKEIWKDIPGYEGQYKASNVGRVKSMERKVIGAPNNKSLRIHHERILKACKNGPGNNGRFFVRLTKNNKPKNIKVHQLVMMAFNGHNPKTTNLVIDHIDDNPNNNNLSNLRLVTQRVNSTKHPKGISKYVGVSAHYSGKWVSTIYINGKNKYLGLYKTELEASEVYQLERKKITDLCQY